MVAHPARTLSVLLVQKENKTKKNQLHDHGAVRHSSSPGMKHFMERIVDTEEQ